MKEQTKTKPPAGNGDVAPLVRGRIAEAKNGHFRGSLAPDNLTTSDTCGISGVIAATIPDIIKFCSSI